MEIKSAKFLLSNTDVSKCPTAILPEYAFIGRSNVGKSSLINMLCNMKGLAKTSSTPGKTELINHFEINEKWYLVDLPGYGFARKSKTTLEGFSKLIKNYFLDREMLTCTFVLIDSRLPPQKIDIDFIRWLGSNGVPFVLAFTKTDKQNELKTSVNIESFKNELFKEWEELPRIFITSAEKKIGRDEILNYIREINLGLKN